MKNEELIEFAIDVVEQYGHLSGKKQKYYWAGGLSTLERAIDILYLAGIAKYPDRVKEFEIRRYWKNK